MNPFHEFVSFANPHDFEKMAVEKDFLVFVGDQINHEVNA